jgi:hypothetical protein
MLFTSAMPTHAKKKRGAALAGFVDEAKAPPIMHQNAFASSLAAASSWQLADCFLYSPVHFWQYKAMGFQATDGIWSRISHA